ncbi:response regulator [Parasynechococcus sp.]|uniref:response regulator n=1 Tax=Parasynechococcus sp. TaxID=3101203 RepID=UPI0037038151
MTALSAPLTVAVVEDDPRIRRLIEDEVVDEGHRVECFNSAEGFLEAITPDRFDLVLLDLLLPGMTGLDCLLALQALPTAEQPTAPVIVVTALNDGDMRDQVLKAGAQEYILKPDLFLRLPDLLMQTSKRPTVEP